MLSISTCAATARAELELGCDEMHFLPVPDSGWSIALLRYLPREAPVQSVTSIDATWADLGFGADGYATPAKLPVVMVPVRPC